MSYPDAHQDNADNGSPDSGSGLSRRQMVTAGVAAGLGVAAVAAPADAAADGRAGLGPPGSTVVEFRGRIDQAGITGEAFTSYGYLSRVTRVSRPDLFDGHPFNESTALLTAFARGDLRARLQDKAVHSLDIVGTMTVYQRAHGGADFAYPSTFKVGTPVAAYELTLQDVLAVYAAGQGIPTLTGDMVQTRAKALTGPLAGQTLGRRGTRLRMFATGLGELIDPATFQAQLEIAGNWAIE
jgi:hypothetical protein